MAGDIGISTTGANRPSSYVVRRNSATPRVTLGAPELRSILDAMAPQRGYPDVQLLARTPEFAGNCA